MKISVITVTYNSAATLKGCIESVLNQTHPDIEYIIVDGLSKDGTTEIIRSYEKAFNGRLRWISEKDSGLYDAMNKGINMATGEVVGTLNSDDFFSSPNVIAQVVRAFEEETEIDALYGDIHYVNPDDLTKCVRYYSSSFFHPKLFKYGLQPAHPSFYCKKEWFEKLGGYRLDFKIAADFELLVRFLYKNNLKTLYLKQDFVTMRTGGLSTRSLYHRHILNIEDIKACRCNGIPTNYLKIGYKYLLKTFECLRIMPPAPRNVKQRMVPNNVLIRDISTFVQSGRSVTFTIRGNSMNPFLVDGRDQVVLSPFKESELRPGAVVLSRESNGHYLLHRIVRREGERLITRGDGNQIHHMEQTSTSEVVGLLKQVIRKNKCYSCKGWVWKSYSMLWNVLCPVRKDLLRVTRYIQHYV